MANSRPGVEFGTSGFNAAERALLGLWSYDADRPAKLVGELHLGQAQDRIRRLKRSPSGVAWPPLKRAVKGGSMLYRTRELHDSLFAKVTSKSLDSATVTVGTTNVKGVHNNPKSTNPLPKREFLGPSRSDMDEINRVIERDLARLF